MNMYDVMEMKTTGLPEDISHLIEEASSKI